MEGKKKIGRPAGTTKDSEGLFLSNKQLVSFFGEIKKSEDEKYGLIFNLILYFGLRVSELCKMKTSDVFLGKTPGDLTITVEALKGGRKRTYERIDPRLARELTRWIRGRTDKNPYLFPSRVIEDGQAVNAQAIKNRFKFYAQKIGLPKKFSVHNLRATCAVRMVQKKFGILEVARWLRLRSVQNAAIYFDRSEMKETEVKIRDAFGSYL